MRHDGFSYAKVGVTLLGFYPADAVHAGRPFRLARLAQVRRHDVVLDGYSGRFGQRMVRLGCRAGLIEAAREAFALLYEAGG